jgi:hypothetical protein
MNQQGLSDRCVMMSNDNLLRVAADRDSLTTTAREALAVELGKRGLDSPDAIRKYEHERDRQIKQEEELAAVVRWSKRSRFQRIFHHLRQHSLVTLLASIGFPALAFLIGYGMVTLRVGNGRILNFLISFMLALGGVCGITAARSSVRLRFVYWGSWSQLGNSFTRLFSSSRQPSGSDSWVVRLSAGRFLCRMRFAGCPTHSRFLRMSGRGGRLSSLNFSTGRRSISSGHS